MVSAVFRKTVNGAAQFHGRTVWHGPAEHGDPLRRSCRQPAVGADPGAAGKYYFLGIELYSDDLGYFPQSFPEHLQAVSGKPEISAGIRSTQGPASPLLRLSQMPSDGPGSPGQGQDLHYLPPVPGKIYPKNLKTPPTIVFIKQLTGTAIGSAVPVLVYSILL